MRGIPRIDAKPFSELVHFGLGRPALVMGGGDSLPEATSRAPATAVFVSANQHGCLLRPCDFIVAADSTEEQKTWRASDGRKLGIRDHGAPIISMRRNIADYRIFKPPINNSGVLAAWVAWALGCSPILLAGMDCYVGNVYYHSPQAQSSGRAQTLSHHLDKWRALKEHVPGAMVRAMGGALALHKVFPLYDPAEPVTAAAPREAIMPHVQGVRVRVVKAWRLPPWRYDPGEELEVNHAELVRGLREKHVQRIA